MEVEMQQVKTDINNFLVDTFNRILRIEEDSLSKGEFKNLSVREMHVIEAVVKLKDDNTAKQIASELNITQSTLTTTVGTLEKKGMLIRKTGEKDKRVVKIYLTALAVKAYEHHLTFHEELVDAVMSTLSNQELEIFLKGLDGVSRFFSSKQP
ncbi:MAG: MarR family transcriptional regulator [Oscillospiraceae bacterium]